MGRHPEADLAQTGGEHGHHPLARACIGGAAAEDRDHVFCLLRTRTQRPHRRHSAEKRNEFAPLHSNAPAASFPRGNIRPNHGELQRCGTSPVLQPQLEAGYPLRSGQQTYDKPAAGEK
jgi:hypothetical protein